MSEDQTSNRHLTDEQFSRMLAGESPSRDAEAHLAGCSRCRAEIESVGLALGSFHACGVAWAEREAPRRVHTPSRWRLQLGNRPVWNAGLVAATAAAVFAAGLHLPLHTASTASTPHAVQGGVSAPVASAPAVPAPTGAELAADNRLLASIDQELSSPAQPTVPLAELQPAGRDGEGSSQEMVAN